MLTDVIENALYGFGMRSTFPRLPFTYGLVVISYFLSRNPRLTCAGIRSTRSRLISPTIS